MIITIPGSPIARETHRNRGRFHYDPQKEVMDIIRTRVSIQTQEALYCQDPEIEKNVLYLSCADFFEVSLYFGFPYPKKWSQRQINRSLWDGSFQNTKPDCDNLLKLYLDCIKEIVIPDDRKICILKNVTKRYTSEPRTVITIEAIRQMDPDSDSTKILSYFKPSELLDMYLTISYIETWTKDAVQNGEYADYAKRQVAERISILADTYGKTLAEIAKKYPHHRESNSER